MNETTKQTISCPECGAIEHYLKASTFYEQNTSKLSGKTSSVGVSATHGVGLGVAASTGTFAGVQETLLAKKNAPPEVPKLVSGGCFGFATLCFGLIVGLGSNFNAFSIITLFVGLSSFAIGPLFKESNDKKMMQYRKALRQYESRWICTRCGASSYREIPLPSTPVAQKAIQIINTEGKRAALKYYLAESGLEASIAMKELDHLENLYATVKEQSVS